MHLLNENDASYERELVWNHQIIPIRSAHDLDHEELTTCRLPTTLVTTLELLERYQMGIGGGDLAKCCSLEISREITALVVEHATELARTGDLRSVPPDLGTLNAIDLLQLAAAVISSRLTYDRDRVRPGFRARVGDFASSIYEAFSNPAMQALRVLRGSTTRGVCRHYASVMTTVFYALRQTSAHPVRDLVGTVIGHPTGQLRPRAAHAWNLLTSIETGTLHGIDVTWADSRYERGVRTDPTSAPAFHLRLADTSRHPHVSALLMSLASGWSLVGTPLFQRPEVEEVFTTLLAPQSIRGQLLLFHMAESLLMPADATDRIVSYLGRARFESEIPDWQARVTRSRKDRLRQALLNGGAIPGLLARIGV